MTDLYHRYCATILIETVSPLKIGTGETGLTVDELIVLDASGLPMIPGTSICGVLRHGLLDAERFSPDKLDDLFGFQKNSEGKGSRLIISEARMVGAEGEVMDGLYLIDLKQDFYKRISILPDRDHCRINHQGVADRENRGKFDSQVMCKGARFVFSLELIGTSEDASCWREIINLLSSPLFRLGGGTRKGFGEIAIKETSEKIYDLANSNDLAQYIARSSRLSLPKDCGQNHGATDSQDETIITYTLNLQPDDFFLFSSGHGDEEVDSIAKREPVIIWKKGKPQFSEERVLIPATSVKGAISHRTAFHYNRLKEIYAEDLDDLSQVTAENNEAVRLLFGFSKDSKDSSRGRRGQVLISDVFLEHCGEKVMNHVAIDRFTGGAREGALFDEKVCYQTGNTEKITFTLQLNAKACRDNPEAQQAFEAALKDISTGMLPLGGKTTKGLGAFSGTLKRNGKEI